MRVSEKRIPLLDRERGFVFKDLSKVRGEVVAMGFCMVKEGGKFVLSSKDKLTKVVGRELGCIGASAEHIVRFKVPVCGAHADVVVKVMGADHYKDEERIFKAGAPSVPVVWCSGGSEGGMLALQNGHLDLFDFCEANMHKLGYLQFLKQVAADWFLLVKNMSEGGVCQADNKPENMFVSVTESGMRLLSGDLGGFIVINEGSYRGTPSFIHPEFNRYFTKREGVKVPVSHMLYQVATSVFFLLEAEKCECISWRNGVSLDEFHRELKEVKDRFHSKLKRMLDGYKLRGRLHNHERFKKDLMMIILKCIESQEDESICRDVYSISEEFGFKGRGPFKKFILGNMPEDGGGGVYTPQRFERYFSKGSKRKGCSGGGGQGKKRRRLKC